jgi:cytoskeletal protein CcmA (bactofilin family)
VLHGKVDGNITASERVELKRCCSLTGDVTTQRIVIEDGAFFKGAIDIKENQEREVRVEQRKAMSSASGLGGSSSSLSSSTSLSAGPSTQGSFLEPK